MVRTVSELGSGASFSETDELISNILSFIRHEPASCDSSAGNRERAHANDKYLPRSARAQQVMSVCETSGDSTAEQQQPIKEIQIHTIFCERLQALPKLLYERA